MFTEEQIKQLQELFAPIYKILGEMRTEQIHHGNILKKHDAQFVDLNSEMKGLSSQVKGLDSEVKGLSSEVKSLDSEVKGLSSEVKGLSSEVKENSRQLEMHRQESHQEHQDIVKAVIDITDMHDKRITRVEKHLNLSPLE